MHSMAILKVTTIVKVHTVTHIVIVRVHTIVKVHMGETTVTNNIVKVHTIMAVVDK